MFSDHPELILLQLVGGQEGMQRENRIKQLEQEVARSTEVSLRLQRDLAEANTKLAAVSGAPPANLKKHTPPVDGVSDKIILHILYLHYF